MYKHTYIYELYHHGIKGMKWGIRRSKEQLRIEKGIENSLKSGIMKIDDTHIHKSLGAKARNYEILDPISGERFQFSEGTKIQNSEVFAGKGASKGLNEEVALGLSKQIGGEPQNWQHCKGKGVIDFYGEGRKAEVHWFQENTVGKHKFKIKEWLE